jgi:ComF family protein
MRYNARMDWGRLARSLRVLWNETLDAILPPPARTLRTKARGFAEIPLAVAVHELLGAKITTLMDYRRPEVQDLVRSLKYDGNEYAAHLCAMILADFLREEIASIRTFSPRPILIVPLPLHTTRVRQRGFNQIALVLRRLPRELRDGTLAAVAQEALVRTRDTPHQTSLPRRERLRNVTRAFAVADPALVRHAHVFLIDDVTTTGATLASAGKPLLKAHADVNLIALARA